MLAKTKEAVVESDLDHCLCFVEIKKESNYSDSSSMCPQTHTPITAYNIL